MDRPSYVAVTLCLIKLYVPVYDLTVILHQYDCAIGLST